jgi:hypothetical protein
MTTVCNAGKSKPTVSTPTFDTTGVVPSRKERMRACRSLFGVSAVTTPTVPAGIDACRDLDSSTNLVKTRMLVLPAARMPEMVPASPLEKSISR